MLGQLVVSIYRPNQNAISNHSRIKITCEDNLNSKKDLVRKGSRTTVYTGLHNFGAWYIQTTTKSWRCPQILHQSYRMLPPLRCWEM